MRFSVLSLNVESKGGEESSEIRGRKLIFEYLEIDFDMGENFE